MVSFGSAAPVATSFDHPMSDRPSLLDELRTQYEAFRRSEHTHADVPGFEDISRAMGSAFRWLEQATAYLDGIKPAIDHRFDLGHGIVFESPRLVRASITQHERRIVGYPVLDEIHVYYEIAAANPLTLEVAEGGAKAAEQSLDDAGLQYTSRSVEDHGGTVRKCVITVPPSIPAAIAFHADYQTGLVRVSLVNVDRFDRVTLEFRSGTIDESVLEDLVR